MGKNSFIKGAAILGIAGLIVKLIGAVYKLYLTNLIGTEGMGYFGPAYNIYNLLLAISLAGFPTAIARMISEKRAVHNYRGAYRVYSVSLTIMFFVGLSSSLLVLLLARPMMDFMGSPSSYYSMIALVPALFIMPILSSYRGFFQGLQNMMPIALSQIFEQIFRIIIGFYLAIKLLDIGLEEAAAGATFGASIGSCAALFVIFLFFIKRKNLSKKEINKSHIGKVDSFTNIIKTLLAIAVPITIGASISPLMGIVDNYFVFNRMPLYGFSQSEIANLYGQLTGAVYSLTNLPQAISTAIAMSLIPVIANAFVKNDKLKLDKASNMGVKISLIIAFPCGVGMFILARPILELLFPSIGHESIQTSTALLQILSISIIFSILIQIFTAILQSVNKQNKPVKNLFIGLIIKVILSYILIGIPSINIKGSAYSTICVYLFVAILNYNDIRRNTPIKLCSIIKQSALPVLSTLVMTVAVFFTYKFGSFIIHSKDILTILSIVAGGATYVVALFLTGAITSEELELLPMGNKLKRFVRK